MSYAAFSVRPVKIFGKPLVFSLSNGVAIYQVDHHSRHEEIESEV